jgi:hypothetical protein
MLVRNVSVNSYSDVDKKQYSLKLFSLGFLTAFSIGLNLFIQNDAINLSKMQSQIITQNIIHTNILNENLNNYLVLTSSNKVITYAKENLNMIKP